MGEIDTVVVGAGHAGLAVSRLLAAAGHEHVILERGRVGERWRSERWDSLHLVTPSWMTRLPGYRYQGADPDGTCPRPRSLTSSMTTLPRFMLR
jgi:putative flavoprotein involved in K+ transport